MKKILLAIAVILILAVTAWAIPPSPPSSGSGSGDMAKATYDTDSDGAADLANYMKSVATTGKISITGPAAGSTRAKTMRDADDTILELGGSYTPSGTWVWTSAIVTWPTFNQNTTGTAANLSSVLSSTLGGTGVANNAASTITISGAFGLTFTVSAATSLTLPTSGTVLADDGSAWTDEFVLCGETTAGEKRVKSCGAKITQLTRTIYLPVAYFEDGAAAPAATAVTASTRKIKTRAFDGASNENLEVSFTAPMDFKASGTIKFRVIGYVTAATAPADTEVVAFSLAGCSNGNSDALGCTAGTAVTSSLTVAGSGYAQNDRLATDWSAAVTVTDLAAGETVQAILIRLADSTDTYVQDFAVAGIEIKYIADIKTEASY